MISQRGSTTTVSGGGGEGGVSAAWIDGNYVAKNYWDQIFTVHGKRVVTVTDGTTGEQTVTEEELTLPPNMLPSSQTVTDEETGDVTVTEVKIVSLQVNAGIWTNSFVSALGLNPEGGGGGGADLNALLASINNSAIGSVAPGASNVGKCLVWTADGWAWGTTGSSGGGTVTAITAGTGLSGGTITSAGTISISTEYQTRISHGQQAWQWGNHANAGYLTPTDIADMATKSWVENQGFVKSSGVTSVGLSVPTGFTVSDSPVTTSGTLALGIASGYFMPTTAQRTTWNNKQDAISDLATIRSNASHGETAYGWGNHADQGYLLRTEGMRFTTYDNYVAARFVTATGAYDSARAAKAQGDGYIEWWSTGGYFNHVMGFIRAKGNVEVGTSTSDTAHYLQIGGGRLFWDNTNNALYVQKADGTAAHFYATGGVSALGMSGGGTPSLNALTLGTLTVTNNITVGSNGILISDPDGDGMIYSSGGTLTLSCDEGILANNDLTVNGALYMLENDILNAGGVYGTSLHSSGMVYLNQELAALAYNKNTGQLILRTRTSTSGAWTDHIISMN